MKALLILSVLMFSLSSFAKEVDTECSAMNESRTKIVKDVQVKTKTNTKGASAQ